MAGIAAGPAGHAARLRAFYCRLLILAGFPPERCRATLPWERPVAQFCPAGAARKGNRRDASPDIGAYEYSETKPSQIQSRTRTRNTSSAA